jgi:hypothetical protein
MGRQILARAWILEAQLRLCILARACILEDSLDYAHLPELTSLNRYTWQIARNILYEEGDTARSHILK